MTEFAPDVAPRVSFGSSGNLLRQIRQGAPFELFLSANEQYAIQLVDAGLASDEGAVYALGRLALIAPAASSLGQTLNLDTFAKLVKSDAFGKLAIANPQHAPYGIAARQVLETRNLWQAAQSHLVYGENAAQAIQFALSGAVEAAIVPLALVSGLGDAGDKLDVATSMNNTSARTIGAFTVLPLDPQLHQPITHRMILVKGASKQAVELYDYLLSYQAREIFMAFGFASIN